MLSAWVLYPAILLAVFLGQGLLVEAIGGRRLPGALLLPVGLAATTVAGLATTALPATAHLSAAVSVVLALAGYALGAPRRSLRPDPWAALATAAVFAVFAAPVVLSGEPTFAGYIKLDDTATWFAITDRLMEHGRSLAGLPPSSYEATLSFNLAGWYPVGAFIPFGVGRSLARQDLAWVFQPYLALLAALTALSLYQLAAWLRTSDAARAAIAFLSAQAALLFSYAMWGGIKELATSALLALAAALLAELLTAAPRGGRAAAPAALACAALLGCLSFGAIPWLGGLLLAAALLLLQRRGTAALLRQGGRFLAWLVPLAALGFLGHSLLPDSSASLLAGSGDLGNLSGPISPAHVLGIWPAHDFRTAMAAPVLGALAIAIAAVAAGLGAWRAWRDRNPGTLILLGGVALGCLAIALFGSAWVAAKAYASASPFALFLACAGALALLRAHRRAAALLVAAVLCTGVVASNVLGYGGVNLAPYGRLAELESIGKRFAGQQPALMTEYEPYGVRHFLRDLAPEGASELRRRQVPLRDGGSLAKGQTADLDRFAPATLLTYRILVIRRSPTESRPPEPFALAWRGRYYDVWVRRRPGAAPLAHLPLGSATDPTGVPRCADVLRLGRRAGRAGVLVAAPGPRPLVIPLGSAARSGRLQPSTVGPSYLDPEGAGSFSVDATLPRSGRYRVWLGGSVRSSATLYVDARRIGAIRQQLNPAGQYLQLGDVTLAPGPHSFTVRWGGADLHPASAGEAGPIGPLTIARANAEARLLAKPPAAARSLCGRRWDWIEALGTGGGA